MASDADEPISIPIERELDLHAVRPRDIPAASPNTSPPRRRPV